MRVMEVRMQKVIVLIVLVQEILVQMATDNNPLDGMDSNLLKEVADNLKVVMDSNLLKEVVDNLKVADNLKAAVANKNLLVMDNLKVEVANKNLLKEDNLITHQPMLHKAALRSSSVLP